MTVARVYAYDALWCPNCQRWMGWANSDEQTDVLDFFGDARTHVNCSAPYTMDIQPCVEVPRILVTHEVPLVRMIAGRRYA